MQRNAIEPILGALVLAAAVAFLFFAYNKAGHRSVNGYNLSARFSSVDGLQDGSDVRIGGVKVGEVTDITLDPATYFAVVTLNVDPDVKLPVDSVASVATEGLLGGKYLGLTPGASDDMLKPGGRINHTEASVSLESMLGQVIYSLSNSDGKSGGQGSQAQGSAPKPAGGADHP
ncbi:MAG TPA: outer membrane lipid asymmetry maintenance protein MlaD [Alphaproteobacteria bacterium]|nr:outer membrane lipid asymmetry maintenance protein MlaD [Alphaproteobacteria bacterium]